MIHVKGLVLNVIGFFSLAGWIVFCKCKNLVSPSFFSGWPPGTELCPFLFFTALTFFYAPNVIQSLQTFCYINKQTIALFTIFKSMNKTNHFSNIFKTYFIHKKMIFIQILCATFNKRSTQ